MSSAADFLQILQRRAQLQAHRLPPPGEFPIGWKQWLAAMKLRPGRVTGAPADEIIRHLAGRPPASAPPRGAELTRWQAFATLWRQQWHPAEPEDRPVRIIAASSSLLWHLLVGALLLWLMYARFLAPAPSSQGDEVVQVEYVGVGTPQEAGGGEPSPTSQPDDADSAAPAEEPVPVQPRQAPASAAQLPDGQVVDVEVSLPEVPQRDVPEPLAPAVAVEQPVTVSEPTPVSEPDVFVLPPLQPRVADIRLATPELQIPARQMATVEVPEPVQPILQEVPQISVAPPQVEVRTPEVAVRDVPAPLSPLPSREIELPAIAAPRLPEAELGIRERVVPAPRTAPMDSGATGRQAAQSTGSPNDASRTPQGTPADAVAGVGPQSTPAPGAWPSPRKADDWGDSARDVPGAQAGQGPGVFNGDGSVRIAETPGSASPGQPPGTITQEIASLDRAGTWLKRRPADFEPSAFDRYWRPHETLLQEWVRKSIKRVLIPIPGTSKSIVCDVSLLALGGGCGISDPNLNEQPATARPPPDIPFKPHLQEDNGSVKPAG